MDLVMIMDRHEYFNENKHDFIFYKLEYRYFLDT